MGDIQTKTAKGKRKKARKAVSNPAAFQYVCPICWADFDTPCRGVNGAARKTVHSERYKGVRRFNPLIDASMAVETESPIEAALCKALMRALAAARPLGVSFKAQQAVGPYRADLMVTKETENGLMRLVVECDGRDWHNSEEQVARDKARDRFMVARGIYVMRFTGSEIYNDAAACAAEVAKWAKVV